MVESRTLAETTAPHTWTTQTTRVFVWSIVFLTAAFVLNTYLSFWQDWPGTLPLFTGTGAIDTLVVIQAGIYIAAIALAVAMVTAARDRTLRSDSAILNATVAYIVRACYYAVLLVGLADMIISFLRVENLLPAVVGADLAEQLGRSRFRGPYVHMPLILVGMIIAALKRDLGFVWLALLVVIAELQIVIMRFIFAYEQAFMGDLVRFWYAALFLFASAYTLLEDGHVRVDVVYAGLSQRSRGIINLVGSILLGIVFCWVILAIGMWSKTSIITTAMRTYEVSQSGYGMYVKYLMAGFLGVFGVTMMIQFCSYVLESLADVRGDPGHREPAGDSLH
jgi:TRAP-type mannitol/chloroaromatic compound transport system permease small subunit